MHELALQFPGRLMAPGDALDREFEARLAECGTAAFRVAYWVTRSRPDAEDVAQEAFIRAYKGFRRLKDRERFREWLVRIAFRLALDRRRADNWSSRPNWDSARHCLRPRLEPCDSRFTERPEKRPRVVSALHAHSRFRPSRPYLHH
jgi:RNA polymerase sigma factor (sigma-70 family)